MVTQAADVLLATAYHEAGHAVAAQAAGLHVHSCTISREEAGRLSGRRADGFIRTRLGGLREAMARQYPEWREPVFWDLAVYSAAGAAGEIIEEAVRGVDTVEFADLDSARDDYDEIKDLADRVGFPFVEYDTVELAHYRAVRLLCEHWNTVEALARLLMEKGSLTGDEVDDILFMPWTRPSRKVIDACGWTTPRGRLP